MDREYVGDEVKRSAERTLVCNEGGEWCGCPGWVITVAEAGGRGEIGGEIAMSGQWKRPGRREGAREPHGGG